jgi:hypothetical protein
MKAMHLFFLLLLLSFLFTGCIFDNGKVDNDNSNIIGLWQECNAPNNTILFRADGTFTSVNLFSSGGYIVNPQVLILMFNDTVNEYDYLLNGNMLSIILKRIDKPKLYYDFKRVN